MARTSRNENKKKTTFKTYKVATEAHGEISIDFNGNDYFLFNMLINGIWIYGCKLCEAKSGDLFISWPSRKADNGSWYAHARPETALTDSDVEAIADALKF